MGGWSRRSGLVGALALALRCLLRCGIVYSVQDIYPDVAEELGAVRRGWITRLFDAANRRAHRTARAARVLHRQRRHLCLLHPPHHRLDVSGRLDGDPVRRQAGNAVDLVGPSQPDRRSAGPGGGSEMKPVGTVVFSCAERGASQSDMAADRKEFGDLGRGGVQRRRRAVGPAPETPE